MQLHITHSASLSIFSMNKYCIAQFLCCSARTNLCRSSAPKLRKKDPKNIYDIRERVADGQSNSLCPLKRAVPTAALNGWYCHKVLPFREFPSYSVFPQRSIRHLPSVERMVHKVLPFPEFFILSDGRWCFTFVKNPNQFRGYCIQERIDLYWVR